MVGYDPVFGLCSARAPLSASGLCRLNQRIHERIHETIVRADSASRRFPVVFGVRALPFAPLPGLRCRFGDTSRTALRADSAELPEPLSIAAPDEEDAPARVRQRIVAALHEAGWDTTSTDLPHAIATRERTVQRWGLYSIVVHLEVTPLGRDHVRMYAHPFRKYVFGKASKLSYLTRPIRSRFLPELEEAFAKHGLQPVGTPFERDDTVLR